MSNDQELRDKLAREYTENCDWSYNIYGDKSDMDWDEQKKYPSDIPSNLELAFKAGWDAARAHESDGEKLLEDLQKFVRDNWPRQGRGPLVREERQEINRLKAMCEKLAEAMRGFAWDGYDKSCLGVDALNCYEEYRKEFPKGGT